MSALTEKVAREHGTYGRDEAGCYCIGCGSTLPNAEIAQHIAEVTEAATRAAVTADIGALAHTHEQVQAGVRAGYPVAYYTGHTAAVGRAVQVAKGGGV